MKVSHTAVLARETEQLPAQTKESHASLRFKGQFPLRETRERIEASHARQSHLKLGFRDAGTGPMTHTIKGQFVKPGVIDIRYTAPLETVTNLPSYEQFLQGKRKPRAKNALLRSMRVRVKPSQPH